MATKDDLYSTSAMHGAGTGRRHSKKMGEAEGGRFHDRTRGLINPSTIAYHHPARPWRASTRAHKPQPRTRRI
jgi:hypothetical protein